MEIHLFLEADLKVVPREYFDLLATKESLWE